MGDKGGEMGDNGTGDGNSRQELGDRRWVTGEGRRETGGRRLFFDVIFRKCIYLFSG